MNGTVVDIHGVSVSVNTISGEHTTDTWDTLTIKDSTGVEVRVEFCYGKITRLSYSNIDKPTTVFPIRK